MSSVINGLIAEFTAQGKYVRDVLQPPAGRGARRAAASLRERRSASVSGPTVRCTTPTLASSSLPAASDRATAPARCDVSRSTQSGTPQPPEVMDDEPRVPRWHRHLVGARFVATCSVGRHGSTRVPAPGSDRGRGAACSPVAAAGAPKPAASRRRRRPRRHGSSRCSTVPPPTAGSTPWSSA